MLIRGVFRIIPNIYNFCENSWLPKVFTTLQYKRNNSPLVSLGIYFDNGTPCLHISLFWHINERTKRYLLGKPTFFQQFSSSFEEKPKIIMVQFNDYSLFNETRLWLELHEDVSLYSFSVITLNKKWILPLRFFSVSVTKSCGFGHIYWRNLWWNTLFFVQCQFWKLENFKIIKILKSRESNLKNWNLSNLEVSKL